MPHRDEPRAAPRVGQPPQRDAEQRVEDGEAGAHEQAHLLLADAQVALDRADEQVEDLPVDEREDVGQREHRDDVPGIAGGGITGGFMRRRLGDGLFGCGLVHWWVFRSASRSAMLEVGEGACYALSEDRQPNGFAPHPPFGHLLPAGAKGRSKPVGSPAGLA